MVYGAQNIGNKENYWIEVPPKGWTDIPLLLVLPETRFLELFQWQCACSLTESLQMLLFLGFCILQVLLFLSLFPLFVIPF